MQRSAKSPTYLLALFVLIPVVVNAGGVEEAAAEKMTITWMCQWENSWAMEEASRLFDVRIVGNGVRVQNGDKVAAMMAASEYPDCGAIYASRATPIEL